jgi:hypothetical protein
MGDQEVEPDATAKSEPAAESGSQRFKHLPDHVKLEDTVESQDTHVPQDPEGGRDTDRDFMIRYSAG